MGLTSHLVISSIIFILCIFPMKIHSTNLKIYNQQFQVWGPPEIGFQLAHEIPADPAQPVPIVSLLGSEDYDFQHAHEVDGKVELRSVKNQEFDPSRRETCSGFYENYKDGKEDKYCCIGINFHLVKHDGRTFRPAQSTDEILGNYTFHKILNGRPMYQSNFDDGKFSIWSCNNCWVLGYARDMPECKGIAYSHHHTSCIDDCNDLNDWNVWNGIDWKTATDLTIDAICKI